MCRPRRKAPRIYAFPYKLKTPILKIVMYAELKTSPPFYRAKVGSAAAKGDWPRRAWQSGALGGAVPAVHGAV